LRLTDTEAGGVDAGGAGGFCLNHPGNSTGIAGQNP